MVSKKKSTETWAGTVKAIGIRSLSTGKFWQFCFLIVMVIVARQINSADWVKIAELFLQSHFYAALGWTLFVAMIIITIIVHRLQRKIYLKEIDRLSEERNNLQQSIIGRPHIQHSEFKPK